MGLAGPNCWPTLLAKFGDGVVASAAFRAMLGLTPESADAAVAAYVFGNRMTHPKSGKVWTREEWLNLRHSASVFDDPAAPYGKHLDGTTSGVYRPHGTAIVAIHKLIVEAQLVTDPDGHSHPTDAHDEAFRGTAGSILSDVIDWLIDNGGPRVLSADVVNVRTTRAIEVATHGMWQSCEIIFPWRED